MQSLVSFLLFAVVASIAPEPTSILVLSNSQCHGLAAAWPIVFGTCAAMAALILLFRFGLNELLRRHLLFQQGLVQLGTGWLSYLARSLFRSADGIDGAESPRRPGMLSDAALQLVNPRAWAVALAALTLFAGEGAGQAGQIGLLALLFFLVLPPCLASWALFGAGSTRLLCSPSLMKRFNQGMALLLLASAWAALLLRGGPVAS